MSCDITVMKCLNAIYKKVVFEDKKYEPEMYDLFKRVERILDNPEIVAEICEDICAPTTVEPEPLPIPQYVDMAYFRNYEQDNRLSEANSTDIVVTAIVAADNKITVNFVPPDVRDLSLSGNQFYVINRSKYITDDNVFNSLQLYSWGMDEFTPNPDNAGGSFTLDWTTYEPFTENDITIDNIFEVGDKIAFINPLTILQRIYPYKPLIEEEDYT